MNFIFILFLLLFFLDTYSAFQIKHETLKLAVFQGMLGLAPLTLGWNIWAIKTFHWKVLSSVLPAVMVILILTNGVLAFMFASSPWKTQTVFYQKKDNPSQKIEFQMQDAGAFGYNKRHVKVTHLGKWYFIVEPFEYKALDRSEWISVDKSVNGQYLKFP